MPGMLRNLVSKNANYQKLNEVHYFNDFWEDFYDIMMSMFKWGGLPETVDEHFMEKTLFDNGLFAWYKDPRSGRIYSLRANSAGNVDMYGYPSRYQLTSYNAGVFNKIVKKDEVVICYNNAIRTSTTDILLTPCIRLANLAMTIDTNINATKTPIIIEGSVHDINSLKTLYSAYVRNEPVLFPRKGTGNSLLDGKSLTAHNTGVEFYADRLLALQHDLENDTLTRLGVNNTNIQKKERLVSNEVDSNLMEIMSHAYSLLDAREKFCELVNEKYDLNVSVQFRNKKEIDNILNNNDGPQYIDEEGDEYE